MDGKLNEYFFVSIKRDLRYHKQPLVLFPRTFVCFPCVRGRTKPMNINSLTYHVANEWPGDDFDCDQMLSAIN